jgi:hypothetical protein
MLGLGEALGLNDKDILADGESEALLDALGLTEAEPLAEGD